MADSPQTSFDFDTWSSLAKDDPASFEALRKAAIEEAIRNAPQERQQYLRALQWRIDQERHRAKTPLGACIRISRMMWERVMGTGGLLDHLQLLQEGVSRPVYGSSEPDTAATAGKVVPFSSQKG